MGWTNGGGLKPPGIFICVPQMADCRWYTQHPPNLQKFGSNLKDLSSFRGQGRSMFRSWLFGL